MLALPLFAFGVRGAAAVEDFTFTHLGMEDGVAGPHIFSICQTQDGVVWWSTKNTVDRFNGRSVKNYFLDADAPYSHFGGRTIGLALSEDGKADLYAYDNKGRVYLYNKIADCFDLVADVSSLIGGKYVILNHLYVDKDGLWVALDKGAYCINDGKICPVADSRFTHFIFSAGDTHLLCTESGVFKADASSSQAGFFFPCNAETGYYDPVSGRIWLGSFSTGVRIIEPDGTATAVTGIPVNPVRSIVAYDNDNVLVGVDGAGVYMVPSRDSQPSASILFNASEGSRSVLHGNGVYAILKDSWGDIFIGTYSGGIDVARPSGGIATIYQTPNVHVNCVGHFPGRGLVLGTDDGVSILSGGRWTMAAEGHVILDMIEDGEDLLLATFGSGVIRLDRKGRSTPAYSVSGGSLRSDHVYSFCRSRDGNLWMGCLSGDLTERTPQGFRYYPVRNVQDIVQLPDGRMAVGTADGIRVVEPGEDVAGTLSYSPESQDANRYVMNLLVDGNRLWIGSDGGGIYILDLENGSTRQITQKDGLPGNGVTSILSGADGIKWIGTENGLAMISPGGKVSALNHIWDLNREYTRGASAILPDGNILLGSTGGAVSVAPEKIESIEFNAPLRIVGAWFKAGSRIEYNKKMARLLAPDPRLRLRYRDNTFELFFESVNLRYQHSIAYRYRMDQGEWSRPLAEGHFRFAEVGSGTHLLEVESIVVPSGVPLDRTSVTIVVAPPVWNTWWMWTLYFLLITGAFVGAWKVYMLHNRYMRLALSSPTVQADAAPEPEQAQGDGSTREFVDSVTRIVLEHIAESDFSIDDLCREIGMSRTYLYMRLKAFTGESPQDFIRIIRMERAKVLLGNGEPVAQVAQAVGFDNPKYFSTVFKKYFDISPSKYRTGV